MNVLKVERHQIDQLRTVAHLFPRSNARQGVYALEFLDGQRYIGQTVNIVGRLSVHRRTWPDISALEFSRVSRRGELDAREQEWIRCETVQGRTLRNIRHALGPVDGDCDLNLEVSQAEQHAWLNEDIWLPDDGGRVESPGQRAKTEVRYDELRSAPLFDDVVRCLRAYVLACVPRPMATELTFWTVSAVPSTNRLTSPRLACVSINSMETLVLGHPLGEPNLLSGFVNVSSAAAGFPAGERGFLARHPRTKLCDTEYEASGPDVVNIQFEGPDTLVSILADHESPVRNAARTLNLRAMRKGPTLQWRAHCPALAGRIFEG